MLMFLYIKRPSHQICRVPENAAAVTPVLFQYLSDTQTERYMETCRNSLNEPKQAGEKLSTTKSMYVLFLDNYFSIKLYLQNQNVM